MRSDLENKLLRRFPHIYYEYYHDMANTCMCWGFTCPDTWFDMLWQLSLSIEREVGFSKWEILKFKLYRYYHIVRLFFHNNVSDYSFKKWHHNKIFEWVHLCVPNYHIKGAKVTVEQVKEKFGTLRYYYSCDKKYRDAVSKLVSFAEMSSAHICADCGKLGTINNAGWITCLCKECKKKKNK